MEMIEKYNEVINALKDKKAKDILSINIEKLTTIASYFVICSGTSSTHIKTIADSVDEKLSQKGIQFLHKEGYNTARWILLDYGDIVVHIFHQEDREFYNLERLWNDGEKEYIKDDESEA